MALDKESVEEAVRILKCIVPGAYVMLVHAYDRDDKHLYLLPKVIYCIDGNEKYGYETVFTLIENIKPSQVKLFDEMKMNIGNTSIFRDLEDKDYPYSWDESKKKTNVKKIGWF